MYVEDLNETEKGIIFGQVEELVDTISLHRHDFKNGDITLTEFLESMESTGEHARKRIEEKLGD